MDNLTRYEQFVADAQLDIQAYQDRLSCDGTWSYVAQVAQLEKLSINMTGRMLVYMFGDLLGTHLFEKFAVESHRNLLYWLRGLTNEYRFFILYELKNNKALFAHG